ncbi:hypothetical protein DIPPA_24836 [Diplonema papillatum]|nr:hypothetical protein DIPPA_24836 [Diplonema papillatum]
MAARRKSVPLVSTAPLFEIKANPLQDRAEWEKRYAEEESKVLQPKIEGAGVYNLAKMRSCLKESGISSPQSPSRRPKVQT